MKLANYPLNFNIFQDWHANKKNAKGRIVLVCYRLGVFFKHNKILTILFFWYFLFYKFFIGWILNIEIALTVKIGRGFRLQYGYGTVIANSTIIGENCTIGQLTTIGSKRSINGSYGNAPIIGNNVEVGVNAIILGDLNIEDNVLIGAGAVITQNIRGNCVMVGNPAFVLKTVYSYQDEDLALLTTV